MKTKVNINGFGGKRESATIIIDKDGMKVIDKSDKYERDSYYYRFFVSQCIDMDGWKHSWHLDVDKAMFPKSDERKRCKEIILEKIKDREEEIKILKDGIHVLSKCKGIY